MGTNFEKKVHHHQKEELYHLDQNFNPNFENEPKNNKIIDSKNVFFENIESYINEVKNNPDFKTEEKRFIYNFIDDDINERQQASDSDSEINIRESNVLISHVDYVVDDNQISLLFLNSIDDNQLGKKILKQIKDQLDVKYNKKNVKVIEYEDDNGLVDVEIENIENIESILMVIKI